MLHRIKGILFPMNSNIQNITLDEYKKIRNISVSVFLIIIQIMYIFKDSIDNKYLNCIFKNEDAKDFFVGIFVSAATFSFIYIIVSVVWQRIWISSHSDSCYIAGIWYHVFDRKIDDNKEYVRAGWLTITQNFYDISVEAYNYDIFLNNGELKYNAKSFSHWNFSMSTLNCNGEINACFIKNKEYLKTLSNSGIMQLSVTGKDRVGNVSELEGTFSDSGSSTVKGNIRCYKFKKQKKIDFDFMGNPPEAWKQHIINRLSVQ